MAGSTPIYGFPYPEPSDLVANYPALGQQLAEDNENVLPDIGGLAPVAPTTTANSGGTVTVSGNTTTFTGVTSVSLNQCFTANYSNYRILVRITSATVTNEALSMRLRAAGSDNSSTNYAYANFVYASNGTTGADNSTAASSFRIGVCAANVQFSAIDVISPFLTDNTSFAGMSHEVVTTYRTRIHGGSMTVTTAYDGFTLFNTAGGSITGTVSVYGYKK